MIVTITRSWFDDVAVEGMLDIDGQFQCYTMENTLYLIPEGEYDLVWYPSGEFNTYVPQVIVPNRTNIELHPANYPKQLLGCTAVGQHRLTDVLEQSDIAFRELKAKLELPARIIYRRNDGTDSSTT